jgi:hypothetical protein
MHSTEHSCIFDFQIFLNVIGSFYCYRMLQLLPAASVDIPVCRVTSKPCTALQQLLEIAGSCPDQLAWYAFPAGIVASECSCRLYQHITLCCC